ncbi:uncharacterized protein LOC124361346 [Homalodisca vitripennis]|uniref:uncharacterized protein LOC124354117 n=2 Tax=Homalodisca vitripennis TaxID=197043 RepID=UPI001EEA1DC0|nr:uncharacterized protein LOC124354117 [Homalodisca vitripennis]XP_046671351.1 uncharacterized protein LOC124361346 [Homalodisca vitripennis]
MALLAIESAAEYDEVVTGWEFHSHKPYASSTLKNNDEIRIPISQQDIITAPFESSIHITGKVSAKKADGSEASISLINNAIAFLFDDVRYEIGGIEVDRTKNVGITSTIKGLLSIRDEEQKCLVNACWLGPNTTSEAGEFTYSVPLKLLMGFAEDYKRIVANVKQELVLLRSATDVNAVISPDASNLDFQITSLEWRVPHVTVSDSYKLKLLRVIEKDTLIHLPFRSWELHEYPSLPQTTRQSWTIKTSSQIEKPRYVVLAFQTGRKNDLRKDASTFDRCALTNVKLYLNSQYYPYDNVHGDLCIFYDMYTRFQSSYYQKPGSPLVDFKTFTSHVPLYVIDCSKQNDSIKSGPVDVRLEFEAKENFPPNTAAYCLLLHDSHMAYTVLTGSVQRIM